MVKQPSMGLLWVIGIVLILLGVVYFSINPQTSILKIGVIAPLSGELEMNGTQMQNAYNLALSKINEDGGINGKTVELLFKDGACDADQTTAHMQELLNVEEVFYVIGGGCAVESDAISKLTQEAQTLFISASTFNWQEDNSLSFSLQLSLANEIVLLATAGYEDGHTRAAVFYQDSSMSEYVLSAFEGAYEGAVVFSETFETQEDLDGLMTTLRYANPQMVLIVPEDSASGVMVIDTLDSNWFNVGMYATSAIIDQEAFLETPSTYEELVIADSQIGDGDAAQAFLSGYELMYSAAPELPMIAASAYDGLTLLAEALTQTGGDSEAAAEYLSSQVNAYSGATGTFSFDESGNTDLMPVLVQVTAGELVEIE